MFTIDCHHSITDINPEMWQILHGNRPFSSIHWYYFLEKALPDDQPIYLILSQDATPIARAILWVKKDEPLPISSGPLRRLTAILLRRWPLLLAYDPLVGGQSSLHLPEEPAHRTAALQTITHHAQSQLSQYKGSFLLYSYLQEEQTRRPGWPANFIPLDFDEPETILPIQWPTFDAYLTWLRKNRKSAYKDYRRHTNKAARAGIEVTVHDTVHDIDQALTLIRATETRHGSTPHPNARTVLEQMPLVNGRWLTATQNGRLIGCGLLLSDNGGWAMKFLGLDYSIQYAYFQLVYSALREVINHGGSHLTGGTGAYQLKERLGFQPQTNTYVGFTSRSRLLGWLGRRLAHQSL